MEDMTTVLAIWGAVLSTVSIVVLIARELRDRPKLQVRLTPAVRWSSGEVTPWLEINVVNLGRHSTTIVKMLIAPVTVTPELEWNLLARAAMVLVSHDERGPVTLGPLESVRLEEDYSDYALEPHADSCFRVWVEEARGARTWSNPAVLYRYWLQHGWRPPEDTRPEMLTRRPELHVAPPVEPRWKVWLPRHLRRPTNGYE